MVVDIDCVDDLYDGHVSWLWLVWLAMGNVGAT